MEQFLQRRSLVSRERLQADGEKAYSALEVPLAFELYGDSTVRNGANGFGVCLQLGPYQLLFDCGIAAAQALIPSLKQEQFVDGVCHSFDEILHRSAGSEQKIDPALGEEPPHFVFCSHAHGDHGQGLLAIHRAWPNLPIFSSQATSHLLALHWPEEGVSGFCQGLPWGEPHALTDDLWVELSPAGHLLGAAAIVVTYSPKSSFSDASVAPSIRVVYLGDCFLSPTRCAPGLELDMLRGLKPELLIAEGTYGTGRYPRRRQQENELVEQLLAALNQKRLVLLPASTLGIAQELIVLLRSHHLCTGQDFDIWVDEPIAQGCDRYLDLLDEMPTATQNFAQNQSLFWDDRVRPYVYRLMTTSLDSTKDIGSRPGLVLIHSESNWGELIASMNMRPGMAWELWLDRTDELSSGASGWATHRAFTHQSPSSLKVLAECLQTGALNLSSYQLTDHCDGLGTTQLIHNLKPQHLLLVHGGSPESLQQLSRLEELRSRYSVHIAEPGVEVSINVSCQSPSIVEKRYGGELQEDSDGICLQLANEIAQDPRWQALAETGLLEVEWQGDGLLIRGLSPNQLMDQGNAKAGRRATDCCKTCYFNRNQCCFNPESPLANVQVLEESYCQEFQRLEEHRL